MNLFEWGRVPYHSDIAVADYRYQGELRELLLRSWFEGQYFGFANGVRSAVSVIDSYNDQIGDTYHVGDEDIARDALRRIARHLEMMLADEEAAPFDSVEALRSHTPWVRTDDVVPTSAGTSVD